MIERRCTRSNARWIRLQPSGRGPAGQWPGRSRRRAVSDQEGGCKPVHAETDSCEARLAGESSSSSKRAQTVISTTAKVAQGAAKFHKNFWPRAGGQELGVDRRRGECGGCEDASGTWARGKGGQCQPLSQSASARRPTAKSTPISTADCSGSSSHTDTP